MSLYHLQRRVYALKRRLAVPLAVVRTATLCTLQSSCQQRGFP